ncbi:hypothetical protein BATDEDRAFT_23061 [Batrachochytrium dendrobatidis JAM81]|uniref:CRAL-TRIO domain-containing protein n=1 Tax=Batrachochytrium dendrobatidis (strain JAM81 / FGSC 10211) TaxID=684364 RepID=F4NWL7_BATDJ|nr:uncharacterized protein BATDEDRAFT_23061 [Batrachochytrium dendrobatidis JAM81]EGF82504.1 hypothetical protein BATDEDRAFT_23061 [Batrachochytrium dendrobatidis JAM81]|eukprot:XP_006676693.1 hypothetical protein BATDEDRAFT_23061 [Batrachochytrium dendrobatidis JAM81]
MSQPNVSNTKEGRFSHDSEDIDADLVLQGDDEDEKEKQIQNYISTSRMLFEADGVNTLTDTEIAKFLYAKNGHRGKAMSALSETLAWRAKFKPETLLKEISSSLSESGKLQFWGKALDGSQILIWTGARHVPPRTEQDIDCEIQFLVRTIEHASHYPERLSRMYIFPTNMLFKVVWNMAKGYLDPVTLSKIHVKESPASLAGWVSRENLFVRYGGLANDPFETDTAQLSEVASAIATQGNMPVADSSQQQMDSANSGNTSVDAVSECIADQKSLQSSYITASSSESQNAIQSIPKKLVANIAKPMVDIENVWEAPSEFQHI